MAFVKVANGLGAFRKILQSRYKEISDKRDRTYIFPTAFGFLFGAISLVLLMMALGYANNLLYLFVFFLISVAMAAMFQTNQNVDRAKIIAVGVAKSFAEEETVIEVIIQSQGNQPSHQLELRLGKTSYPSFTVNALQQKVIELPWRFETRGLHTLPRLQLQSSFPFQLLRSWKVSRRRSEVLVYPARKGSLQFPVSEEDSQKKSENGLFRDLREFQNTDSPLRIDWRASAKHQQMLVKNFETQADQGRNFHWNQTSHLSGFEQRVSQLATWIDRAERMGLQYSLTIGPWTAAPSRGQSHYHHCLQHLALLQPGMTNG